MRIFLSFNSKDATLAKAMRAGILKLQPQADVFFSPVSLGQGFWLPKLAEGIGGADAFLLLLGPKGVGPWQEVEYHEAFDRHVQDQRFALVPVIAGHGTAPGLPFLRRLNWIEAPDIGDAQTLRRILAALNGEGGNLATLLWKLVHPYRGLESMTEANADYFYGRAAETEAVLQVLAHKPGRLPVLIGASGVGKSSVAQAGVLSALKAMKWPGADVANRAERAWPEAFRNSRADWAWLVMRPSDDPLHALASAFTRLWLSDPKDPQRGPLTRRWAEGLKGANTLIDLIDATQEELERRENTKPARILLYLDQGEELYTRATAATGARRFSELLVQGLGDTRLVSFASLRADYFDRLQADEALFAVREHVDVPPLTRAQLEEVVTGPVGALGVTFESERLAQRITDAAANAPGALPLLSYLMTDMWSAMQVRGDGVLRLPVETIDVGGVLAARAEDFLNASPAEELSLKSLLTLRLALVPADGEPVRRPARREECTPEEWALAERLSDHPWRLVVTNERDGEVVAEVAHEALLRAWPRLAAWLRDERDFLVFKGEAERAERRWQEMNRAGRGLIALLAGLDLARAEEWLPKRQHDLSKNVVAFINKSISREKAEKERRLRFQRRVSMGAGLSAIILAAIGAIAWLKWGEAERERDKATAAENRALALQAETATQRDRAQSAKALGDKQLAIQSDVLAGFSRSNADAADYTTAMLVAIEGIPDTARKIDRPFVNSSYAALLRAAVDRRELTILHGKLTRTADPQFISDGRRIVTREYEGLTRLWDSATGLEIMRYAGKDKAYVRAVVSHDGSRLVTWTEYHPEVLLWDTQTGKKLAKLELPAERLEAIVFTPNDRSVVGAGDDNSIRYWSANTGALEHHIQTPDAVRNLVFSIDGTRLATYIGNELFVWDTTSRSSVARIQFAPNAWLNQDLYNSQSNLGRIIAGTEDNKVILYDTTSGSRVSVLKGHSAVVRSLRLSPDGQYALTTSDDGTMRVWRIDTGVQTGMITDREYPLMRAFFNMTGTRIVTVGGKKFGESVIHPEIARLWNASDLSLIATLEVAGHRLWGEPEFTADGTRLLTHHEIRTGMTSEGPNYTHTLWDAADGKMLTQNRDFPFPVLSHDTKLMLRCDKKSAMVIDVIDGKEIAKFIGHRDKVVHAAFSEDDARVVTSSDDGSARIWTLAARADAAPVKIPLHDTAASMPSVDPNRVALMNSYHSSGDAFPVYLFDFQSKSIVSEFTVGPRDYGPIATNDYRFFMVAKEDGTVVARKSDDFGEVVTLGPFGRTVQWLGSNSSGHEIVLIFDDSSIKIFDVATWKEVRAFPSREGQVERPFRITDVLSITSPSGVVQLWPANGETPISTIKEEGVIRGTVTLSSSRLVTIGEGEMARLWDVRSATKLGDIGRYVAVSGDGNRILSVGTRSQIWDATEARVLAQLQLEDLKWAEFVGQDRVVTLDDRATEGKGVVQMWNLLNGRLIGDIFEGRRTDYLIDVHDPFVQVQSGDDTLLWNGRFERPFVALLGSVFAISPDHRAILARLQSQWVLVKTFPEPQEAIEHVKINTPRCLTRRQRRDFFLDPDPPRWCITGAHHENDRGVVTWEGKWPYQGQEWIEWLSAKDRGERPPMPKSVD